MSRPGSCPPAPCFARAFERPRVMMADVIQDRRVTEPAPGFTHPAFVDGSRLYWALPSPVHEGLGVRALRPTGYKVMRCSPHCSSWPNPGSRRLGAHYATLHPAPATFAPCSLPSRRGLATPKLAIRAQRRPALTAAARGAPRAIAGRDEETASGRTKKLTKGDFLMAPP
jgi:hypothetical protein